MTTSIPSEKISVPSEKKVPRMNRAIGAVIAICLLAGAAYLLTRGSGPDFTTGVCAQFDMPDESADGAPTICFRKAHPDYRYDGTNLPPGSEVDVSVDGQMAWTGTVGNDGTVKHDFTSEETIISNNIMSELRFASETYGLRSE